MFASFALTTLLTSLALHARADPDPTTPGPGDSFNEGSTCHIAWSGDPTANSPWKVMNIELMSGSNLDMNHITTVTTTSVDGSTGGTHDYPCPQVTPNSAIYFYQFSTPTLSTLLWTTRFTIASSSGQSTPPANSVQPGTNAAIPWGTGALVNAASATPPPPIGNSNSNSTSPSGTTSSNGTAPGVSTSTAATVTTLGFATSPGLVTVTTGAPGGATSAQIGATSAQSVPSTAAPVASPTSTSAAVGAFVVDSRFWQAGVGIGAAAFAFVVLL